MMYWSDSDWGWGSWIIMTVSMVAFWCLIAWVVVSVLRSGASGSGQFRRQTGEEILAERFARGEIDENEYSSRIGLLQLGTHS